jgi:hypothetical protein
MGVLVPRGVGIDAGRGLIKECHGTIISDVAFVQALLQAPFHEQNELPVPVVREAAPSAGPPLASKVPLGCVLIGCGRD